MNHQNYCFRLSIDHPNFGGTTSSAIMVDGFHNREILRPLDLCDDPMMAMAVGAPPPPTVSQIRFHRQQLARDLAAALTERIMKAFDSKDTRNGYPQ